VFNYAPSSPGSEKVRAKFDLVLQQHDEVSGKKKMDFSHLSLLWNQMVEKERISDPQTKLLPTNAKMIGEYHKVHWRNPNARTNAFNPPPAPAPPVVAPSADGAGPSFAASASSADSPLLRLGRAAVTKMVHAMELK
jgi:hypothetical protein